MCCNNEERNCFGGNENNMDPGFNRPGKMPGSGCPQPVQPQGKVKYYNKTSNINGANYSVVNKNYYNNYYNRYNNYNVTDCNIVKDYVKDYNVYHYDTKTIDAGCEYLGSVDVVANNCGCGGSNCHCNAHCNCHCNCNTCC